MRVSTWIMACVLLLGNVAALACSCGKTTPEAQFDWADHVFVAQIVSLEDMRKDGEAFGPDGPKVGVDYGVRASFRVLTEIKGDSRTLPHLGTGYGGGDCGMRFLPGMRYLVATKTGTVGICSLSRPFDPTSCADVDLLERLRARAADGTTELELPDRDAPEQRGQAFIDALMNGADPFTMTSANCPRDP